MPHEVVLLTNLFFCLYFSEALSTVDIAKLQSKVVDVIPPEVIEDMSVSQLQVKLLVCRYRCKRDT